MSVFDYFTFINILRFCNGNTLYNISLTSRNINNIVLEYYIHDAKINFDSVFMKCVNERRKESISKLLKHKLVNIDNVKRRCCLDNLLYCNINFDILSILHNYNFFDDCYNYDTLASLILQNKLKKVEFMLRTFCFTKEELNKIMINPYLMKNCSKKLYLLLCSYRYSKIVYFCKFRLLTYTYLFVFILTLTFLPYEFFILFLILSFLPFNILS